MNSIYKTVKAKLTKRVLPFPTLKKKKKIEPPSQPIKMPKPQGKEMKEQQVALC